MCKSTQQGANRKGFIIDNSNNVELNGLTLEGDHKYGIQLVYTVLLILLKLAIFIGNLDQVLHYCIMKEYIR